jgi:hypothetical protein
MGKTIQIIALLVTDLKKPNLVVAWVDSNAMHENLNLITFSFRRPTVAVMQWKNEIAAHTEGLSVLIWHGASRESDIKQLKKYDVVWQCFDERTLVVDSLRGRLSLLMPSWKVVSGNNSKVLNARERLSKRSHLCTESSGIGSLYVLVRRTQRNDTEIPSSAR